MSNQKRIFSIFITLPLVYFFATNVTAESKQEFCVPQSKTDIETRVSSDYFISRPALKEGENPGLLAALGLGRKQYCSRAKNEEGCGSGEWLSDTEFAKLHAKGSQVTCTHHLKNTRYFNGKKTVTNVFILYTRK